MAKVFDFIVLGSGLAGLSFALKASKFGKVLVLTKATSSSGSTNKAQGGIASVISPEDSHEKHIRDTLVAGAGLCVEKRVEILVREGPSAVQNLINWGVRFSKAKQASGEVDFDLAKEGGHSEFRILHSDDLTGQEIQRALLEAVRNNSKIELKEQVMGIDLITNKHLKLDRGLANRCYGLYSLDMKKGKVESYFASHTMLCTGGVGQLYSHTTNDSVSTGDGTAMAFRAGVPVEDMEFIQFHPTSLYDPGQPTFLVSEALRGHGGVLRNQAGEAFMKGVHPLADLAPRDVVARAIDAEMKQSGSPHVYLDMTVFETDELKEKYPNIYNHCYRQGINMSKEMIPVVPAAHFICGGIQCDENSKTSLPGLYTCGETASTGVHGANRLASNSLLEAVVFSNRALRYISQMEHSSPDPLEFKDWDQSQVRPAPEFSVYSSALETIRSTMWNYVGIVRNNKRLERALSFIDLIQEQVISDYASYTMEPRLIELRNLALNAELIIKSAIKRKESRGLHYNEDYPGKLTNIIHSVLRKDLNTVNDLV